MLDALNGDVKRLTASNEHLQHTNSALQDRILEVESESITRDRESATESDVLREASRLLSQQLKDVVEDFNQIKTELKATEEKQRWEQQEQKQQIVDLRSSIDVSSRRKAGPLDLIAIPRTKGIFADSWQRMKRSQKPRRLVILQLKPVIRLRPSPVHSNSIRVYLRTKKHTKNTWHQERPLSERSFNSPRRKL